MADVTLSPNNESTLEYAEYILACSDQSPATFVKSSSASTSKSKSIHQKLVDLYVEESTKQPENSNLVYASHLLSKLTKKERLNCMVLSLYPGNEGYSIMLRSRNGVESETMKLPYEESEILDYVDSGQLPPFLLDLLEKAQMNVFYSGCVITEVRDYRRSAIGLYDTQHVLLRPSPQSILRDISAMSCDGHTWTQDDLFHLESELVLATEEPLCLDPSPAVMLVENVLQYQEKFLANPGLKRSVRNNSQAAVNRKRKLAHSSAPNGMKLHDFLSKKKKTKQATATGLTIARSIIDTFKEKTQPILSMPESIDVKKYMKVPEVPSTSGMIFVEEHTMERDPSHDRHMMAKITIYQPQLGDSYFGEFYLDHDYGQTRTGEEGQRCRFELGSRQSVVRYIQQFRDMFTEKGKVQVKIAVRKAHEVTPTITYTQVVNPSQGVASGTPAAITISGAQALMKQVALNQAGVRVNDMGTVASLAAKRNIPIQLSLSIGPANAQGSTGAPTSLSAQFLASSVSAASVAAAQRLKASATGTSQHRPSSSPLASPAAQTKSSTAQQALATGIPLIALPKAAMPTPAQTPPLNSRTPTPTPAGTRRSSTVDLGQQVQLAGGQGQLQQQSLTSFIQGLTSAGSNNNIENLGSSHGNQQSQQQQQQQNGGIANISLSNISSLPPNINIQGLTGLPGVNIANLTGLQQMQVSLAQIAVPVPISMINTSTNLLQAQAGGLLGNASSTTGTNSATLVTMVTALPASSSTSTSTSGATQIAISSGTSSNTNSVIPQASGMLSIPVGLGGLTQLMPVNSKTQSGQGQAIRTPTAMPVLQLQGQQGIQLLSLQHQRGGQAKPGGASSAAQGTAVRLAQAGTSVPLSSVLTSQQVTALAVTGKQGTATASPLTAQQLLQLAGSAGTALGQGSSQRATHLALSKGQQGLQFRLTQAQPQTQAAGIGKGKAAGRANSGNK